MNKFVAKTRSLVSGTFSLPITFWLWGVAGGVLLDIVGCGGIHYGFLPVYVVASILKFVLFAMVLSGLFFILKKEITLLALIAFFVVLLQVLLGVVKVMGFSVALYEWFLYDFSLG
ncbi:hypothetical protein [Advenella mimigardefordensis]|uniref:Putative membrane protein n=1 Tax=Advenella mimigardefordensis (strain DSM 17166 / LMG 22922 / DPN7) TaxID=1247726 RepID=W0PJ25_ADVMD|nr:hypothetical protein [Advenella mimigardefordensis]AHG65580.1 putative membrane protein [Advenella mimigardefordensis DPN7]